jgi:hypothetical protein
MVFHQRGKGETPLTLVNWLGMVISTRNAYRKKCKRYCGNLIAVVRTAEQIIQPKLVRVKRSDIVMRIVSVNDGRNTSNITTKWWEVSIPWMR